MSLCYHCHEGFGQGTRNVGKSDCGGNSWTEEESCVVESRFECEGRYNIKDVQHRLQKWVHGLYQGLERDVQSQLAVMRRVQKNIRKNIPFHGDLQMKEKGYMEELCKTIDATLSDNEQSKIGEYLEMFDALGEGPFLLHLTCADALARRRLRASKSWCYTTSLCSHIVHVEKVDLAGTDVKRGVTGFGRFIPYRRLMRELPFDPALEI